MSMLIEYPIENSTETKEQISQHITELFTELSECREDERNTQNQILQAISVAGAILGIFFGIGFFKTDSNDSSVIPFGFSFGYLTVIHLLFYLSCLIFCTVLPYITTLGIQNALRYYYIRDIEKRLAKLIRSRQDGNPFTHWVSYSAPIITRNVHHLSSRYTKIYYFCYTVAAICAILFCNTIIAFQFLMIAHKGWFDWLCFGFFLTIVITTGGLFFYITAKAKNVADYAFKTAINRENKVDESHHKTFFHNFIYFIYPRTNDLQKPMLIVASYFAFAILFHQLTLTTLYHLLISLIIFDALACQARFQINDIRGWDEDAKLGKHTMGNGNKTRLAIDPEDNNHPRKLIKLSLLIAFCKMILAALLTLLLGGTVKIQLFLCLAILVLFTISYECVRSRNNERRTHFYTHCIFILVGSGYPLRVAVGAIAACPEIWKPSDTISLPIKVLIIIALWAYGSFSSTLAWADEVAQALDRRNMNGCFVKYHYTYIYELIRERYLSGKKHLKMGRVLPLRAKGRLKDPWTIAHLIAVATLSLAHSLLTSLSPCLIIEILFCLCYCIALENHGLIIGAVIETACVFFEIIWVLITSTYSNTVLFVFILKLLIISTYFYLRYLPQFNPINISKYLRIFTDWLLRHLIGQAAFNILRK